MKVGHASAAELPLPVLVGRTLLLESFVNTTHQMESPCASVSPYTYPDLQLQQPDLAHW